MKQCVASETIAHSSQEETASLVTQTKRLTKLTWEPREPRMKRDNPGKRLLNPLEVRVSPRWKQYASSSLKELASSAMNARMSIRSSARTSLKELASSAMNARMSIRTSACTSLMENVSSANSAETPISSSIGVLDRPKLSAWVAWWKQACN